MWESPAAHLDILRTALVELTPGQVLAVEALASGSTHAEAADAAGVTRETVTRWSSRHPGFRAALDRYRYALAAENADLARRIRGKALVIIGQALVEGDVATALAVLRAVPDVPPSYTADADAFIDGEVRRVAFDLPPLPPPRNPDGTVDVVAQMLEPGPPPTERAERVAVERLADAAGVTKAWSES